MLPRKNCGPLPLPHGGPDEEDQLLVSHAAAARADPGGQPRRLGTSMGSACTGDHLLWGEWVLSFRQPDQPSWLAQRHAADRLLSSVGSRASRAEARCHARGAMARRCIGVGTSRSGGARDAVGVARSAQRLSLAERGSVGPADPDADAVDRDCQEEGAGRQSDERGGGRARCDGRPDRRPACANRAERSRRVRALAERSVSLHGARPAERAELWLRAVPTLVLDAGCQARSWPVRRGHRRPISSKPMEPHSGSNPS